MPNKSFIHHHTPNLTHKTNNKNNKNDIEKIAVITTVCLSILSLYFNNIEIHLKIDRFLENHCYSIIKNHSLPAIKRDNIF